MSLLSLIICTFNRKLSLKDTLESLILLDSDSNITIELIVVDNNSSDGTPQVVDEFKKKVPFDVLYVFEDRQGLSFARNAGIRAAKGELLVFTDDDIIVDKSWVRAVWKAYHELGADMISGRVLPAWEVQPPSWLKANKDLYGCLALLDYGNDFLTLREFDGGFLYGANMAVRRSALREVGLFDPSFGHKGKKMSFGDDTDLLKRFFEAKKKIIYTPEAIVYHKVPLSKMKLAFFARWKYQWGKSYVHLRLSKKQLPLWLVKECLINFFKSFGFRLMKSECFIQYWLRFCFQFGQISELFLCKSIKLGEKIQND